MVCLCLTPPESWQNATIKEIKDGEAAGKDRCPWELQARKMFGGWVEETMSCQKVENQNTKHVNKVFTAKCSYLLKTGPEADSEKAAGGNFTQ